MCVHQYQFDGVFVRVTTNTGSSLTSSCMFLPSVGGKLSVGATTFVLSVPRCHPPFSSAKVRSPYSEIKDVLVLEEVAFTAFYPADVPPKSTPSGLNWMLRPLKASLQGYSSYSGISSWLLWPLIYLFGALLKIPVYLDAPLLDPHDIPRTGSSTSSPWPLVIFSHGLGGGRTVYSQLCTRIASSGRVVLAMEHRDGTGPIVIPSTSDPIPYIKEADLVWPSDHPPEKRNMLTFRGEQLDFRRKEIYYAFQAIRNLVRNGRSNDGCRLKTTGDVPIDWPRWTQIGPKKPIECDTDVVLAGHSFGAATIFSILSNAPPGGELPIPVQKALILDPWLDPMPSPGPLPHRAYEEGGLPDVLIINSERFTLWKGHFERVMELVSSWSGGQWDLLTIVRCEHISFSDFRVLPCMLTRTSRLILDKIVQLSLAFLDGDRIGSVLGPSAKKMEIRVTGQHADGRLKRRLVGDLCDVVSH